MQVDRQIDRDADKASLQYAGDTVEAVRTSPVDVAPFGDTDKQSSAITVSVVIPAYNASGSIERALDSVFNQTKPPIEIIVVDDASTDETGDLVRRQATADSRVRLITLDHNGGPSAARNAGIAAAKGDWLAFLDADDLFAPDRLEQLEQLTAVCEADLLADNLALRDEVSATVHATGITSLPHLSPLNLRMIARREIAPGDASELVTLKPMVRRAFLESSGMRYRSKLRYGEDLMFVLDCLLADGRYHFSTEIGYLYTERVGGISGQPSGLSRTRYDGVALANAISEVLNLPAVRQDPTLAASLRTRLRLVRQQSAKRTMRAVSRKVRKLASAVPGLSKLLR